MSKKISIISNRVSSSIKNTGILFNKIIFVEQPFRNTGITPFSGLYRSKRYFVKPLDPLSTTIYHWTLFAKDICMCDILPTKEQKINEYLHL